MAIISEVEEDMMDSYKEIWVHSVGGDSRDLVCNDCGISKNRMTKREDPPGPVLCRSCQSKYFEFRYDLES